ncbi:AI-2E family transporter [Nocardioides nanhaiensis]|uniref:AI-2E family transporter n=1 Tax=Nocardioides nanhaiensis TaxID=1476871 RepID=A0ABP8W2R7_9ACTN
MTSEPPTPGAPVVEGGDEGSERRWRRRWSREVEGSGDAEPGAEAPITRRLAGQWSTLSQLRDERMAERRAAPAPITHGPSNTRPAEVPWGIDLAAAWGWRLLVIAAAGYLLLRGLAFFAVLTMPLAIALLLTALLSPLVALLRRAHVPRSLASIVTVIGALGVVGALLTFAGQQVANDAQDLATSVVAGLDDIRTWLKDGPLNASDSQINDAIKSVQDGVQAQTADDGVVRQVTEIGAALGNVVAGFFIVLFASYFFLYDGGRIWAWVVRLAPRGARRRMDSSGRIAWISLTQFVRATVLVALVDSIGVMTVALLLGVPLVLALGVLVFLGAFVPLVGATVAGSVAVLVALVDQGPVDALLMLGGVILVQQIESHLLQPFLMGRFVSVHPLGVILALGAGIVVGGVAGALVAVPLAAALNAVVLHLAGGGPDVPGSPAPPDEGPPDEQELEAVVEKVDDEAPLASDPRKGRDD